MSSEFDRGNGRADRRSHDFSQAGTVVIDSQRNRSLEWPVVLADGGVLPHFGRQHGGVRIMIHAPVALLVKPPRFVADLEPFTGGIGLRMRSFHKRLPFWPK